jgi:hypothetical protein
VEVTAPMHLSEFVVPVLSTAGPVGLAYVILRTFPQVSQALMVMLATIVAIFARNERHRQSGLEALGKLTGNDDDSGKGPPSLPKP